MQFAVIRRGFVKLFMSETENLAILLLLLLLFFFSKLTTTLGAKIEGSLVFSIKNVYFEWAYFVRFLKFEVMSHNNQSGKFIYFIGSLSLIVFGQNFFLLTGLKSLESLSFKLQIYF